MLEIIEHGSIRELRFARPPVNALDPQLLRALLAALEASAADRAAALLLSGQPGVFSAGLDVPALLHLGPEQLREFWRLFFAVQARLASSPVPVIAAITGHCPAGGTVLALYCDHRVMARGAFRIGLNEVQVGLVPGRIVHGAFERLVGARQAAALLTRGALLTPEEALAVGLIDELVEPGETVPLAIAHAQQLAALPAAAMARTRELVRRDLVALFTDLEEFFDEANALWYDAQTQQRLRALFVQRPSST